MADELSFYQIKPNKCEVAQANLMVELMNFKNKQLMPIPRNPEKEEKSIFSIYPSNKSYFFCLKLNCENVKCEKSCFLLLQDFVRGQNYCSDPFLTTFSAW